MLSRSLQAKFIFPVSALVITTTLLLVAIISIGNSRSIEQAAQRESQENLSNVGRVLAVTDTIMMERVKGSMKLLMERGGSIGIPRQGNPVAINDKTPPNLTFGSQAQANRFELVDGVTSSQGGTATLFSRDGEDFVRISTNVIKDDQRAIGTQLDPQGQAIKAIRAGKAFYGQVDILGTPYLTGYEPMHDSQNRIVGVWYVGYKVDMQALQESIAKSRVLSNGFITLLDDKGKVRFHSDNVTHEIALRVANTAPHGWVIKKETFTPWGFEMVAAYPKDEVSRTVMREVIAVVGAGVVLGGILIGLLIWLARSLVIAPLKEAVAIAGKIANGNLASAISTQREDEIGVLLKALNHMQESLRQMIERITHNANDIDRLEAAKQHLQKLDQMKSDFLSSVSHELRTPLTSIRGFASLVDREFSRSFAPLAGEDTGLEKKSRRIRDNLAIILKESERLTRLINNVLDLAKIEAGRIEWQDSRIEAGRLAQDAANVARGMFDLKSAVALRLDIEPDLPSCIGDADKLLQVLVNLLNNAIKFTEQGEVCIKAFLNPENLVQVEIRDTGIGFPPEDAEAIFDKFQQSNHGDTLAERPKGTGLGLSITREIVSRHDGKIWAQSTPGQGSVFAFTLPPATAAELAAIAVPPAPTFSETERPENDSAEPAADRGAKGKVLVVDDDLGVRNYLCQLLRESGYDVIAAPDGQAALTAAKAHRPDLITMDLAMPVMDGHTAIVNLRADPELQHIPIMVVSAMPGWETAGGDLAMDKPIDEPRFLENVRLLLDRDAQPPTRTVRFLMLHETNQPHETAPASFTAHCEMEHCALDALPARLKIGFRGMVVVPTSLLGKVDLGLLQATPNLEIIIMPQQAEPAGIAAPQSSNDPI